MTDVELLIEVAIGFPLNDEWNDQMKKEISSSAERVSWTHLPFLGT